MGHRKKCYQTCKHIACRTHVAKFLVNGEADCFSLSEDVFLSYVPLEAFAPKARKEFASLSCLSGNVQRSYSWDQTKAIFVKVHKRLCGHANFTNMRLLLQRNNIWFDVVADYVAKLVESCTAYLLTAISQPSHKASISSLSRKLSGIFSLDHFNLESVCLLHSMDMATRYFSACIVPSMSVDHAILEFESASLSQFWISYAV